MLTRPKHHAEIFVFISCSKTTHLASLSFSDSCFSAGQTAKISLHALTVASLDNHLLLHARCNCRPLVFIIVWCSARQADCNGETVKHFIGALKCFCSFVHHTVQICGSRVTARSEAVRMTMHRYPANNLASTFCARTLSAYNIAAVYCNSCVQENMLSSNRFTSIQGKTISEFRVSLQNFRVSFWHP